MMDIDTFWKLVEDARRDANSNRKEQENLLIDRLAERPEEDIIAFQNIFNSLVDKAYRANLWDAAHLICCGCNEGAFLYFRAWLISQGKEVFEEALRDPETLISVIVPEQRYEVEFESFAYIASYAYTEKTGQEIYPFLDRRESAKLIGELNDEEELPQHFPRLYHHLGECD